MLVSLHILRKAPGGFYLTVHHHIHHQEHSAYVDVSDAEGYSVGESLFYPKASWWISHAMKEPKAQTGGLADLIRHRPSSNSANLWQ